ncbi:MAG: hypothetical protein ACR2PF_06550 [Rhizobiaceae bacterium]
MADLNPLANIRLLENALPQPLFGRLHRAVQALDDGRMKDKETYATTFWFAREAPATNVAEDAIAALIGKVDLPEGCIGMEWWLGRLRHGKKLNFHFDRDLALARKTGESVFPLMGSILYLNDFPTSPTVILDQVPGPDGKSKVPEESKLSISVEAVANHYVTYPGNLRHGVIPTGKNRRQETPELRLTLLINYWHRRPSAPICRDYDGSMYPSLMDRIAA